MNRIQDAAGTGYLALRRACARRQAGLPRTRTLIPAPDDAVSGRIAIRPARTADRDAIREFLAGLSPRTRYLRFFTGAPGVGTAMLRLLAGGGASTDALVATEADAIIGHAMAADTTAPSGEQVTDIGVAVTDRCQGHGIGSALIRELMARARARGASTVAMDVLAENRRVLAMVARGWPAARYDQSGPYVTIRAPLAPGRGPARPGKERPRAVRARTGPSRPVRAGCQRAASAGVRAPAQARVSDHRHQSAGSHTRSSPRSGCAQPTDGRS